MLSFKEFIKESENHPMPGMPSLNSPKGDISRQCLGKKPFKTPEEAQAEILRSHKDNPDMQSYHCPWCNNYHNGNRPGHKQQQSAWRQYTSFRPSRQARIAAHSHS